VKTAIILSSCFAVLLLMTGCQTAAQTSNVPLEGTDWILAELNGQPIVFGQNQRTSTLKLDPATKRASGMSGVNRFSAPYELNGSKLKFGNTMGTRMAGPPEAMARETAFLTSLPQVSSWKIIGNTLELANGARTLLKFTHQAVP
jgi:heat shock protein HslJ